jgi:general stress protein YciG
MPHIGSKGGNATKTSHDPDYYHRIGALGGSKGGQATRDKYGHEFFVDIGVRGGARMKEIIAAGKAALAAEAEKP